MSFENDLVDVPARIVSYSKVGYERVEAARLAKLDLQQAAEEVLEEDRLSPVTVEIENLEPVYLETTEEINAEHNYNVASDAHAIMQVCNHHRIGLNDTNYRMMAAIQNSLLARNIGEQRLPKMESIHAEGISPRELTTHMEDASNFSFKEMWNKLKQSFINGFNRIKTWYIKAFDATNRLGKKATALKVTAENKQGTIKNNTFDFGGLKTLAINGKVPDTASFPQVIQTMSLITQNVLGKNAEYYNKFVENMDKALGELIKQVPQPQGNTQQQSSAQQQADFTTQTSSNNVMGALITEISNVQKALGGVQGLEIWQGAGNDERFKDVAATGNATVYKSKDILPGDKMVVMSVPNVAGETGVNDFKEMKLALGMTVETIDPKPRELEDNASFRTLNASQVVSICDAVIDACKAGIDYKLLFAQRDKAFNDLGKQLEQTVNQADNLQGNALTFMRGNVSACTSIFGKINSGEGRWFRYAMGVFTKAVDYGQQSINQIQ